MCYKPTKHIKLQSLTLQGLAPTLLRWYGETGDTLERRFLVHAFVNALNQKGFEVDVRLVSSWLRDKPRVGRSPSLCEIGIIAKVVDTYAEIPYGTSELKKNLQRQLEVV